MVSYFHPIGKCLNYHRVFKIPQNKLLELCISYEALVQKEASIKIEVETPGVFKKSSYEISMGLGF